MLISGVLSTLLQLIVSSIFLQLLMIARILLGNFLLKSKSEVKQAIPQFFHMVLTQFKVVIKGVRSYKAKKLSMVDFYKAIGVVHYLSYVERLEQNFVVERKHKELLNVGKAVFFQSCLPLLY